MSQYATFSIFHPVASFHMNRFKVVILLVFPALMCCKPRTDSPAQTLHNREFNWTISIPENFASVSPEEWAKLQNKGAQAIENTFGEKIENRAKTIFVFKNGDYNYLESNYQPFDPEVDGDYIASCRAVNEIIYETFRTQIPTATLDSASSVETISGLEFRKFGVTITLPAMKIRSFMYNRLFGKKDFSVNITYVDDEPGKKMMESWQRSVFFK